MAGLEDVEAWLDASDKNGVTQFSQFFSRFHFRPPVNCIPSIHGWSGVKTAEKVKVEFVEIQRAAAFAII